MYIVCLATCIIIHTLLVCGLDLKFSHLRMRENTPQSPRPVIEAMQTHFVSRLLPKVSFNVLYLHMYMYMYTAAVYEVVIAGCV